MFFICAPPACMDFLLHTTPPPPKLQSMQVRFINSGSAAGEVQSYLPSGLEISLWKLCWQHSTLLPNLTLGGNAGVNACLCSPEMNWWLVHSPLARRQLGSFLVEKWIFLKCLWNGSKTYLKWDMHADDFNSTFRFPQLLLTQVLLYEENDLGGVFCSLD